MRDPEAERKFETTVVECTPFLTAEIFADMTEGAPAIILISYATGTTPDKLNPIIAKRTANGVPVFLLSNNAGENHGILKIAYGTQASSALAGAITIEKVNINSLSLVLAAIQDALDAGKRGTELAAIVKQQFAFGDEPRPLAEWDIPACVDQQEDIFRKTLGRQGVGMDAIDAQIASWRYGGGTGHALRDYL